MLDLDAHLLSREYLTRCLELATMAAQAGSALGRALVETKTVGRFLEAVGRASVNTVRARGEKPSKGRPLPSGLEIWDVKVVQEE